MKPCYKPAPPVSFQNKVHLLHSSCWLFNQCPPYNLTAFNTCLYCMVCCSLSVYSIAFCIYCSAHWVLCKALSSETPQGVYWFSATFFNLLFVTSLALQRFMLQWQQCCFHVSSQHLQISHQCFLKCFSFPPFNSGTAEDLEHQHDDSDLEHQLNRLKTSLTTGL